MTTMKKFTILFSLFLSLLLISCDELNTPTGDNRLLAFSLTTGDGTEYVATISEGDVLELTIPRSVDLSGAKPTYRISQNAQILPLPERVEDWSKDQVFAVKSSNTSSRSYLIHINRPGESDAAPTGSVYLYTDEDLANFLKTGTTDIMGNLVIGAPTGTDSISDISALTRVTSVAYNIIVNPTYKGKDLQGLRNIRSAGAVLINDCKYLEEVQLKSLEIVHQDFTVKSKRVSRLDLPKVTTIQGSFDASESAIRSLVLPSLEVLGGLTFTRSEDIGNISMPKLRTVNGDIDLSNLKGLHALLMPSVEQISGKLSVSSLAALKSLNLPHLTTLRSLEIGWANLTDLALPEAKTIGNIKINSAPELAHINLSALTEVQGDLELISVGSRSLNQIGVKKVGGRLSLDKLTSLSDVSPFLAQVKEAKEIEIVHFQGKGNIDLSKTKSLAVFKIDNCPNVETLILPEEMEKVSVSVDIGLMLPHLLEIKGVKKVTEQLSLSRLCPEKKTEVYGIESLEEVGSLSLTCANITRLYFPNLKRVTSGSLYFLYITNYYVENSDKAHLLPPSTLDFPLLEEVESIDFNSHIIEMLNMPKLKKADKIRLICDWPLYKNDDLKDLSLLTALEEVREVQLQNMKAFDDYSFLKKAVENGSLQNLRAGGNKFNPSLSDLKAGRFTPSN